MSDLSDKSDSSGLSLISKEPGLLHKADFASSVIANCIKMEGKGRLLSFQGLTFSFSFISKSACVKPASAAQRAAMAEALRVE
jgi:hypothetical protein